MKPRTARPSALRTATALALVSTFALAGCGSKGTDSTASAPKKSCVDTSGSTVKLGFVNSLTGPMAISEKTVSNVLHMATDEINADGGIMGKN